MVYDEIRHRVKKDLPLSAGAEALDVEYRVPRNNTLKTDPRGGIFKWETYEDWHENSWKLRVLSKQECARIAAKSGSGKQKWGKYRSLG